MSEQLLKNASKNLKSLLELKHIATNVGDYELGSKCREMELEKYPILNDEIEAKALGQEMNTLFRMVGLDIDPMACYRITKALEIYKKKKSEFDMMDGTKIIVNSETLFIR